MFIICEGVFDPFPIYYIQDVVWECYSGVKIFEGISSELRPSALRKFI